MTVTITNLKVGGSVCLAAALLLAGCGGSTSSPASSTGNGLTGGGSAGLGTTIHQPVPTALRRLPLTNQRGQRVDLASWPGRTVVLVPFLTLCQDVCPLTTGNLLAVEQSLQVDHAASKVQIVELTVDPGRDTAARLAAYGKLTHSDWQLVTASPAEHARGQSRHARLVDGQAAHLRRRPHRQLLRARPDGGRASRSRRRARLPRVTEPKALQIPRRARPPTPQAPATARLDPNRRIARALDLGGQAAPLSVS